MTKRQKTTRRAGVAEQPFYKATSLKMFKHGQYVPIVGGGEAHVLDSAMSKIAAVGNPTWLSRRLFLKKWRCCYGGGAKHSRPGGGMYREKVTPESHGQLGRVIDDHHSPLGPEKYIRIRLEGTMRFYQSRVSPYFRSRTMCAVALMLASVGAAVIASLNMSEWISIVSIIGSSITSWTEFSGTSKKLGRYANAISKLRDIRLWWETLSAVQQASSKSVNLLVSMTEDVINHDSKAWLATSQAAKSLKKVSASSRGHLSSEE